MQAWHQHGSSPRSQPGTDSKSTGGGAPPHLLNAQALQVLAGDLVVKVVHIRGVVLAIVEVKGVLRVQDTWAERRR